MTWLIASARNAFLAGLGLASILVLVFILIAGFDGIGFVSFLLRALHVAAAMVWVGLIVFVNVVQLAALQEVDEAGRSVILTSVARRVADLLRHASGWTVLSGALLLLPTGYLFARFIYGTAVHVPGPKLAMLTLAIAGGVVMWVFVNKLILPSLDVVMGSGDGAAKAQARARIARYARLNLVLALPVTVAMIAVAHLN